jgi:hypothetical protein
LFVCFVATSKVQLSTYFSLIHATTPFQGIIIGEYPLKLENIDILLQVNCVYFEELSTKKEYLSQIRRFYDNANPKYYLLEVIDASFKNYSNVFPDFVRISEKDIYEIFKELNISSYLTYQYPKNTSTKRLYVISRKDL